MALKGELDVVEFCPDCKRPMPVKVRQSGAGFYIGQWCDYCGPYNRLSLYYYDTRKAAQEALDNDTWVRRDTDYHPPK